jgi:ABC-type branched-subunit amino acid transport system ATPase component
MVTLIRSTVSLGKTICLIEHNLDVVEALYDWVVFLTQGELTAEGRPQEVLGRADLAEVYFGGARSAQVGTERSGGQSRVRS